MQPAPSVSRRQILAGMLGVGAAAGLTACGLRPGPTPVGPGAVAAAESARATTGRVRSLALRARPFEVDLGGRVVTTWGSGNSLPGA
ncbi:MAG: multicopper oxidase family protein, partial [Actinomycetes bacterium]